LEELETRALLAVASVGLGVRSTLSQLPKMSLTRSHGLSALDLMPASIIPFAGRNVNLGHIPGNQAEATIAINPTDLNNLVAFSNDQGKTEHGGILEYVSNDAGNTWTHKLIGAGDRIGDSACCDGEAAFDQFGNLFVTYIDFTNRGTTAAKVALSTDGGQTFSLLAAFPGNADQPAIATGAGMVWVVWNDTDASQYVAAGARVAGRGLVDSFQAPEMLPGAKGGDFGNIVIGPSGQVMVVYQHIYSNAGSDTIYVNTNSNGQGPGGFGPQVKVTDTNVGSNFFIPAQPNRLIDAEANLAWDRSGGPDNGRVYLVYTDAPDVSSNDTDIFVRYSDDDGATWSPRIRVNDDTTAASQFLPQIAVDQTTGTLALAWYDARNSSDIDTSLGGTAVDIYTSVSTDGGQNFSPNVRVTQGRSTVKSGSGFDFGDFNTMDFYNGVYYPVWADYSNSTDDNPGANSDVYTARITLGPAPFSVSIPTAATAGVPFDITVTAADSNYRGTVHFSSSDSRAQLPDDYTFTAADQGSHTFTGIILGTPGVQTLRVTDNSVPVPHVLTANVTVSIGAAAGFFVTGPPFDAPGSPAAFTVKADDAEGNPVPDYTGTIHFTSSDSMAVLPADYTFTAADQGVHTFNDIVPASVGKFSVTVTDTADPSITGSTSLTTAIQPLSLSADGSGSAMGSIATPFTANIYSFVAPVTGVMSILQEDTPDSNLDSVLTIFDASQPLIAIDAGDSGGSPHNGSAQFNAIAGQTYYIQSAGFRDSTGDYVLTLSTVPSAAIMLSPDGTGSQLGSIAAPFDVNLYSFVAPVSGLMSVHQDATSDSSLDSVLTIFDATSHQIVSNDDTPYSFSLDSFVQFHVDAGQTYYVQSAAFQDSTGAYELTFNTLSAQRIILSTDGFGSQSGSITAPGDLNLYSFVAPVTGSMIIHQDAALQSNLDSVLTAFDANQTQIAFNDDSPVGGTLNSFVQFRVVAGQTYYVQAGAFADITGDYILTFSTIIPAIIDDPSFTANVFPGNDDGSTAAVPIGFNINFFGIQTDSLFVNNNGNVTLQAPSADFNSSDLGAGTGPAMIAPFFADVDTRAGNPVTYGQGIVNGRGAFGVDWMGVGYFNQHADLLDSFQLLIIDRSDTGLGNFDFQFNYGSMQWESSDLSSTASVGYSDGTGNPDNAFELPGSGQFGAFTDSGSAPLAGSTVRFQVRDGTAMQVPGETFATAQPLTLSPDDTGSVSGEILTPSDANVYRFLPTSNATVVIRQDTVGGSNLVPDFTVFDDSHQTIASNVDADGMVNGFIQVRFVASKTYYLQVTGIDNGAGPYALSFELTSSFASMFATAVPLTLDSSGAATVSGSISKPGESHFYSFTAPFTGLMSIHQNADPPFSGLDSVLTVFNQAQQEIAFNDDSQPGITLDSFVQFNVVAGQTYYIQAGAFGTSTGHYRLIISETLPPPIPQSSILPNPAFTANALGPTDDGSTGAVSVGFNLNFFGYHTDSIYINNNGNVTFQAPLDDYTPFDLSTPTSLAIIAPFFADVDTRPAQFPTKADRGSNVVTYGQGMVDGRRAFGVDWIGVGYFPERSDRLDSFQLVLIDRSDTGPGNFDIEFNYGSMQWDTTESSGASPVVGCSDGTGNTDNVRVPNVPGVFGTFTRSGTFLDSGSYPLISHPLIYHAIDGQVSEPMNRQLPTIPPIIGETGEQTVALAESVGPTIVAEPAAELSIGIATLLISGNTQLSGTAEAHESSAAAGAAVQVGEFEGFNIGGQADMSLEFSRSLVNITSADENLTSTEIAGSLLTGRSPKAALMRQKKGAAAGAVATIVSGDDSGEGRTETGDDTVSEPARPMIGLRYGKPAARPTNSPPPSVQPKGNPPVQPKPREEGRVLPWIFGSDFSGILHSSPAALDIRSELIGMADAADTPIISTADRTEAYLPAPFLAEPGTPWVRDTALTTLAVTLPLLGAMLPFPDRDRREADFSRYHFLQW
jgi:hypothetical protein